jgi:hypothetical protein
MFQAGLAGFALQLLWRSLQLEVPLACGGLDLAAPSCCCMSAAERVYSGKFSGS